MPIFNQANWSRSSGTNWSHFAPHKTREPSINFAPTRKTRESSINTNDTFSLTDQWITQQVENLAEFRDFFIPGSLDDLFDLDENIRISIIVEDPITVHDESLYSTIVDFVSNPARKCHIMLFLQVHHFFKFSLLRAFIEGFEHLSIKDAFFKRVCLKGNWPNMTHADATRLGLTYERTEMNENNIETRVYRYNHPNSRIGLEIFLVRRNYRGKRRWCESWIMECIDLDIKTSFRIELSQFQHFFIGHRAHDLLKMPVNTTVTIEIVIDPSSHDSIWEAPLDMAIINFIDKSASKCHISLDVEIPKYKEDFLLVMTYCFRNLSKRENFLGRVILHGSGTPFVIAVSPMRRPWPIGFIYDRTEIIDGLKNSIQVYILKHPKLRLVLEARIHGWYHESWRKGDKEPWEKWEIECVELPPDLA